MGDIAQAGEEASLKHMGNIWFRCINIVNVLRREGWSERSYALAFNLFLAGVFVYALIETRTFPPRAVPYPLVVGCAGLIAAVISLFGHVHSLESSSKQEGKAATMRQADLDADHSIPPRMVYARAAKFLAWIIGYYLAIFLLGLILSSVIFFIAYFRIVGKARWWVSVAITLITVYFMFGIAATIFGVTWPTGIFDILADPLPVPGFGLH
jgi:cytochrome c oxidase subunit IV